MMSPDRVRVVRIRVWASLLTVAAVSREHSNRVQLSNFIERTVDETHRRVK
jgi:hypothetical protein